MDSDWRRRELGRGLCNAAGNGQLKEVKRRLQEGADVNGTDWRSRTPLSIAVQGGHREVVKLLLSKGAKCNGDVLCKAAGYGWLDVVDLCLQNGVDVNHSDRPGMTPLIHALKRRRRDVVALLLSKGAKCNDNLLCDAARDGWLEVVDLLLQNGVDVNQRDIRGMTPLIHALEDGNRGVVALLLSKGAKYDCDVLCYAARFGQLDMIDMCLQNGVDVNHSDRWGRTPLIHALESRHRDVVALLLSKGAKYSDVLLRKAAGYGWLDVVDLCLQNGVDVNHRDRLGWTPLISALQGGHNEMVNFLLSKGAEITSGRTADCGLRTKLCYDKCLHKI